MFKESSDVQQIQEENTPYKAKEQNIQQRMRSQDFLTSSSNWIPPIFIFFIAFGFNLYRLGNPSLWFDEILSVERAQQPLSVLLQIICNTQPNMALYYISLHFWLQFTTSLGLKPIEFVVRFPSAIFAALGAVMIFILGRRFLGMAASIVAAGMYLLNVLQLVYAQETRSYAMQLLLICIAWYAFLRSLAQESHQKRWWITFIVATVLAIYTQLFSVLIWAAQVTAFVGLLLMRGFWSAKVRKQLWSFIVSFVTIFVLITPMIYESKNGSKTGWLPIPHLEDIYHLFLTMSAYSKFYLLCLLIFCTLGLTVIVFIYLPWGKLLLQKVYLFDEYDTYHLSQHRQWLLVAFALLCWLIVPIALSYIISQGSVRLFSSRYLVTVVPPLVLLVGLAIVVLRWRIVQVVLILALFFLALYYVPTYYHSAQVEDWNSTSHWLEQHYQDDDGLVCYDNALGCQVSIEYYLNAYPSAAHFTPDSPDSFSWVNYDLTNHVENTGQAVNPAALAVFGAHHPRVFFIIGRLSSDAADSHALAAQQWLDSHYSFIAQIVTRTVKIRLYSTSRK